MTNPGLLTRENVLPEPPQVIQMDQVGIDDRHHDAMVRARMGLISGDPAEPWNNFSSVWPAELDGLIEDRNLAYAAAHAQQRDHELGMKHEARARANANAIYSGLGVLTFIGGEFDGLKVGPFLSRYEHASAELAASIHYEAGHSEAVAAVQMALDGRPYSRYRL